MKEEIEKLIEKWKREVSDMKEFLNVSSSISKPSIRSNIKSKEDAISDLQNLLKQQQ